MKGINLWSIGYLSLVLLIFRIGEVVEFVQFIQRHPAVLIEVAWFSFSSAVGQSFIFLCVTEFGPLPCSIITTVRKLFTVLASVIYYGHSLITRQWLGTVFVFAGIFLDVLYGKEKKSEKVGKD